jgi:hypothetical protein
MAGISQQIPNYSRGMSEQPDKLKTPGQVKNIVNGIPDVTYGLFKRPGSKRVGDNPLADVQSGGSWFHYYRDENEGSYIGQVDSTGNVRIWKASGDNAGAKQNIAYGTGGEAAIKTYLSASNTEDIQALTINDTTFFNNRNIAVKHSATLTDSRLITTGKPENQAYVELLRTENGRQYGLNIATPNAVADDTLSRATRITIKSDTLKESEDTGNCPGIGTQVFNVSSDAYTGSTFSSSSATFTTSDDGGTNNKVTVTFTGHGYKTGDQVNVSGVITDTRVEITKVDANSFYYVLPTDQNRGDHTGQPITIASPHANKTNLIFRLTILGQLSTVEDSEDGNDFQCTYNREITLLHGGEGWNEGDIVTVTLDTAKGGGGVGKDDETKADYVINVAEAETASLKADVKIVRPIPTPFDSDTAVTADTILGGIQEELSGLSISGEPLNISVIGNGLFLSCANPFTIEIAEKDLMRVMQKTINDVTELPNQCKDGYIVKVANARMSDEDDYYLKFTGDSGDGVGAWSECAAPGIIKSFDPSTMPHVIQRTSIANMGTSSEIATFTIKQFTWGDRLVGDEKTNPIPTFVSILEGHPEWESVADNKNKYINKVLFFRNRLAFLSGENVVLCKPGTIASPDFWSETALTVSSVDPIDIACSSTFPSSLYDGIEINTGLLVFSDNQQFLLSSDDTVLNPDTAKLRSVSTYNYNKTIPPISLGTTIGYIDNSGKYSRFNQMTNIAREGEPIVMEESKIVPTILEKNIDLITNSRENQIVLFGNVGKDVVIGFRYFVSGEKRLQGAWFKWKFNNTLKYHFIINDNYYYLDKNNFLQSMSLVQDDTDISINKDSINYQIHLDNYITGVTNGVLNTNTNETTFFNISWVDQFVETPNGDLVIVDGTGRYAKCIVNGNDITVPGDWSITPTNFDNSVTGYTLGYLYDYQVDFPTIYPSSTQGEVTRSDANSSLTLHRLNFNFGKVGSYETTLTRLGKDPYTEIYESMDINLYEASDAPYLEEEVRTIPVYERNKNVDITLKSTNPTPATLHSMSWEGDYTTKYYRRV